jgi:hypothetical protein
MSNFFELVGLTVLAVPAVLGIALLGIMWRSLWLYPAWSWFIVPLGVPSIRFWHFAALLLLVDTLKTMQIKKDDRKTEPAAIFIIILWPIAVWALLRWMR